MSTPTPTPSPTPCPTPTPTPAPCATVTPTPPTLNSGLVQLIGEEAAVRCTVPKTRMVIQGFLVDFLTKLFSDAGNLRDPLMRQLIATGGPDTKILIAPYAKWSPATIGIRPALMLKQNAEQRQNMVIGEVAAVRIGLDTSYECVWVGSFTIFCISKSDASAEGLATTVKTYLEEFGPWIRDWLGLKLYHVQEVGDLAQLEESREHYAVPVTIGTAYSHNWTLKQEALPLKQISVQIN